MRIIYCHHAMRDFGDPPGPNDDITLLGEKDAVLTGQILVAKKNQIKAIYTSPYLRCRKTAELVNQSINVPIIEDARLNEYTMWIEGVKQEGWVDLQKRMRASLKDIVEKYGDSKDNAVVVVTSGVNVVAFINAIYRLEPSEKAPFIWIPSCSPMVFDLDKSHFETTNE